MFFSKTLLYAALLTILSTLICCNGLKNDPPVKSARTSSQSPLSNKEISKDNMSVTGSIIKSSKRRNNSISKHVKFADQVLDDSIGSEPLVSKDVEIKSTGKESKKTPTTGNSSNSTKALSLIWFCTTLTICLVFQFN